MLFSPNERPIMSMSAPFRSMENGNPNKEENATNHPGTSTEPEKMSRAERLKKIRADIQAKKQKKLTIANMNDFVAPNPVYHLSVVNFKNVGLYRFLLKYRFCVFSIFGLWQ